MMKKRESLNCILLDEIRTTRLLLRPIAERDINDIFEMGKNAETCKLLRWGPYIEKNEAMNFVKKQIEEKQLQFVLVYKNKVIGTFRLFGNKIQNNNEEIAVSYVLNYDYRGKGFMTEAMNSLFERLFTNYNIDVIYIYFVTENILSENVMKRLKMKKDMGYEETGEMKGKKYKYNRYFITKKMHIENLTGEKNGR